MARKTRNKRKRTNPVGPSGPDRGAQAGGTRAGSHAGRGFRFQDAVSAWLAIEIWAEERPPALVIPEGGDDVELRGETTAFVQVKSRREHLGFYSQSTAAGYINALWARSRGAQKPADGLELILERDVTGLAPASDDSAEPRITGALRNSLSSASDASDLLPKTSIRVEAAPQESAIARIIEKLGCPPIAAQMCFADLLIRIGELADANGQLKPKTYLGLSLSDTDTVIRDVLEAIDVDAIERALRDGVCEPVDFLTPIHDPNFYLGVDVEPGHIAAGLIAERPQTRVALLEGLEKRRAALIAGPSGSGKSAAMWDAANCLRHTVRWFRLRRFSPDDMPSVLQLIRTYRASKDSPLGFVMDDVGRSGPEAWGALLKEALSVPGVILLGSVREEDIALIAERARSAEIRAEPDEDLAERLWRELHDTGQTEWPGWREPWQMSNGLLLEYAHILTRGQRLSELLADQVAARIADPERALELDILRCGAFAGAANAEIDAARLAQTLEVSEADLTRALQRLIEEHLIRAPAPGAVTGLHQLRSEELLKLTHETALPTLQTSFTRTAASVTDPDLERLIANTISMRRLSVSDVIDGVAPRLAGSAHAGELAAALRGLASGRVFIGVDEWLQTEEARALPRTQIGSAAMFGVAGVDLGSLSIVPEIQAAARRLTEIKGAPDQDPRRLLISRFSPLDLSALIDTADLSSLDEILASLIGMPMPSDIQASLMQVPAVLLDADLTRLASLFGSLTALDPTIAEHWVNELGQEALFARLQAEIAWTGPISIDQHEDGVRVCCDYYYVAGSVHQNPHDQVVRLCELMLALCPSADIAISNAITASGALAGLAGAPIAEKRIPRENLPQPAIPLWNRQWSDLIARRVAAPNYSDYLTRGLAILNALVPTLEKVFDAHLRGKHALERQAETLNALNRDTESLTPPAVSPLDAAGIGIADPNKAVTPFQNLLHSASVNLITRFAKLPGEAGAYIAWLSGLIDDVDTALSVEPWQLIGEAPEAILTRFKTLLETLRALAGEAHERSEAPVITWAARGKGARAGNALRLISISAATAGERRLAERKADIERRAENAGIVAQFHQRENIKRILPWPPADMLALLPATDTVGAALALAEGAGPFRALIDRSTHLTIMPSIGGRVAPTLAKSGFDTLLPALDGGADWARELELPQTPSAMALLFSELTSLASELGAMEQLGLGADDRPKQEINVRQNLTAAFTEKQEALAHHLASHEADLQNDVLTLIAELREGEVDFAAEGQAALSGEPSSVMETIGVLTIELMDLELAEDGSR